MFYEVRPINNIPLPWSPDYVVLQIRRDNRGNLAIIHKNIFCDPSLEPSRQAGSNEGSQHMFSLIRKIFFELSIIPPLMWSSDYNINFCPKLIRRPLISDCEINEIT